MKKLLFILFIIIAWSTAHGQGDDSTKYVWYRYQYGTRMARAWWDSVLRIPAFGDTSNAPRTKRAGQLMLDTSGANKGLYAGYDNKWNLVTGGGGGGGSWGSITGTLADQTDLYDSLLARVRKTDSLPSVMSDYVTQYQFSQIPSSNGDTTIFSSVLDSTGQRQGRVLVAGGNNHIISEAKFVYDTTNHKLGINVNNISQGGPTVGLVVGGNKGALITGNVTGNSFIKINGLSTEFLKADGSVDANTYLTTATAASTYTPLTRTITINGTTQDLSANRTWNVGTVTQSQLDDTASAIRSAIGSGGSTPTWQQTLSATNGSLLTGDNRIRGAFHNLRIDSSYFFIYSPDGFGNYGILDMSDGTSVTAKAAAFAGGVNEVQVGNTEVRVGWESSNYNYIMVNQDSTRLFTTNTNNNFSIQKLPFKSSLLSTDSLLLANSAGRFYKVSKDDLGISSSSYNLANFYLKDSTLSSNRTVTGKDNTYGLTLDSLNYFLVTRNGEDRIYMNSLVTRINSPDNSQYFATENDSSYVVADGNQMRWKADSTLSTKRISYTSNIASTYTEFSLITKHDLDSSMATVGGGGWGTTGVVATLTGDAELSAGAHSFFISQTAYPGGLFYVNNSGLFRIGDDGYVNNTNVYGDDAAKTITYNADNGHTFTGDIIHSTNTSYYNTTAVMLVMDSVTKKFYHQTIPTGGGGYTNLTQFVAQNNWKLFYSNGSGDVQELSLGAAGKIFYSTGSSAAPSFYSAIDLATSGTLVTLTHQNTTDVGMLFQGISSQTGDFLQFKSSGGSTLTAIDANGYITLPADDYPNNVIKFGSSAQNGYMTGTASGGIAMILPSGGEGGAFTSAGAKAFTYNDNSIVRLGSGSISNNFTAEVGGSFNVTGESRFGDATASPSAYIHIAAGTSSAGTAPLKLTSGTNLATTEAGAIEFDGTHLYFTATNAGTRYQLDQQSGGGLTVGTSSITGGSNGNILYNNSGVLGELTKSGSGNVAMTTSPTLTTPVLASGTYFADVNGNEWLAISHAASAVNYLTLSNAATSLSPRFTASGDDSNVGIEFAVKGAGLYNFIATTSNATNIRMYEDLDNGSNVGVLTTVASLTADRTYTFPDASTNIPISSQQITWSGLTAARTITLPDAAVTLASLTGTETLTNKRITKRVTSTASGGATPTMNTDNADVFIFTAQAAAITSMTTNLSGTPTDGQFLWIAITDDGTPRTISWGTGFEASTVPLPTTTVASTRLDIGFVRNAATSKWRCVATQ